MNMLELMGMIFCIMLGLVLIAFVISLVIVVVGFVPSEIKIKKNFRFDIVNCDSDKIEFTIKAKDRNEAIRTVRQYLAVIEDDYWIEFPL